MPDGAEDKELTIQDSDSEDAQVQSRDANAQEELERITPGNIEDDLHLLEDFDWVIEVVIENLDVKRSLYSRLCDNIGPNTILSSNTSTLPRSKLPLNYPQICPQDY